MGFGLWRGSPARDFGLLLRRHDLAGARLTSRATLPGPVWTAAALPDAGPVADAAGAARAAFMLRALARRVEAHERWIAARCGAAYRAACAAERPRHVRRRCHVGAAGLVAAWDAAAAGYAAHAAVGDRGSRPRRRARIAA